MFLEFKLQRVNFSGDVASSCVISYDQDALSTNLEYIDQDFGKLNFDGDDLFSALVKARKYLEDKGFLLLCAGSMPSAYPSGMSRQMSNGRKAYVHKLHSKPDRSSVVDIFQPVSFDEVGTIQQQNEFMSKWNSSF